MSHKVSAFKTLMPMPKTAEKFVVVIPGLATTSSLYSKLLTGITNPIGAAVSAIAKDNFMLLCHQAVFPTESWQSDKIWSQGHYVDVPTRHNHPGDFKCVVSENMLMQMLSAIESMIISASTDDTRELLSNGSASMAVTFSDLAVHLTDQFFGTTPAATRVLKNCWLKEVAPINLDWRNSTTPIDWTLTFSVQQVINQEAENQVHQAVLASWYQGLRGVFDIAISEGLGKRAERTTALTQLTEILAKLGIKAPLI